MLNEINKGETRPDPSQKIVVGVKYGFSAQQLSD